MAKRVLYTVSDSPPGRTVQMALKYLDLEYEVKTVDFDNGEQFSDSYREMYPQGELPVLDDSGFIMGESVAITQYLASKYPRDDTFYPKEPLKSAIVHHRLAFYLSTYYRRIQDYYILPMDYSYVRTAENEKKLNFAIKVFDEILAKQKTAYAAGETLTIADLPLFMGTVVLKALEHNLEPYTHVLKWFDNFQLNHPQLWSIAKEALDGFIYYDKNPRNLQHLNHPIHPTNPIVAAETTN